MPVDLHPEQKLPGVEVILSTLHAGGKFSDKSYQFSGGLHGVGVSVVNALSEVLEVTIRRDGNVHSMAFSGGEKTADLAVTGVAENATPVPVFASSPTLPTSTRPVFRSRNSVTHYAPRRCSARDSG